MPFIVKGAVRGHEVSLTLGTAKLAFAKAVEWHVVEKIDDISIHDGVKSYSIDEFASVIEALR